MVQQEAQNENKQNTIKKLRTISSWGIFWERTRISSSETRMAFTKSCWWRKPQNYLHKHRWVTARSWKSNIWELKCGRMSMEERSMFRLLSVILYLPNPQILLSFSSAYYRQKWAASDGLADYSKIVLVKLVTRKCGLLQLDGYQNK